MTQAIELTESQSRMMARAKANAGRYIAGRSECPAWDDLVDRGLAVAITRRRVGLSVYQLTK